ncbi:hypothetical protein BDZ45DRAFT_803557 [Acephala macrosclerotiorum]|nr:hypothetical protein BDZ45DRAFT_803557 [Acephala macrosclerotiorum]
MSGWCAGIMECAKGRENFAMGPLEGKPYHVINFRYVAGILRIIADVLCSNLAYWEGVGTSDQSLRLNALQFAAKIHEILIAASLSLVAINYLQYELLLGSGLSLSSVLASFQITGLSSIMSPGLGRSYLPKGIRRCRFWFIVLLLVLIVLYAIAGPSSAILMLPASDWWSFPPTFVDDCWTPSNPHLYIAASEFSTKIYYSDNHETFQNFDDGTPEPKRPGTQPPSIDVEWANLALPPKETIDQLAQTLENNLVSSLISSFGLSISLLIIDAMAQFRIAVNVTTAVESSSLVPHTKISNYPQPIDAACFFQ